MQLAKWIAQMFHIKIVSFLTWMIVGGHQEELAVKME